MFKWDTFDRPNAVQSVEFETFGLQKVVEQMSNICVDIRKDTHVKTVQMLNYYTFDRGKTVQRRIKLCIENITFKNLFKE